MQAKSSASVEITLEVDPVGRCYPVTGGGGAAAKAAALRSRATVAPVNLAFS